MEPEWWAEAPEAERYGKLSHGPGFYHCGRQHLHHGFWSPSAEPQRLTKNTHRYSLCFCWSHGFPFSAPLSLFKQVLSLLPYCTICFYRHPCCQHVFGPDLHNPSTWPTNTLTSPGSKRNFHRKTSQQQNPTALLSPENHCPTLLQAQKRKQRTREKQPNWQRESGV